MHDSFNETLTRGDAEIPVRCEIVDRTDIGKDAPFYVPVFGSITALLDVRAEDETFVCRAVELIELKDDERIMLETLGVERWKAQALPEYTGPMSDEPGIDDTIHLGEFVQPDPGIEFDQRRAA